jgi:hypothetical protein
MWPTMRLLRLLALAVVTCAVFSTSASATDAKIMVGTACQPRTPLDREDIVVFFDGATNTNQTESAFVLCPIVRDNTLGTTPDGVLRVNLHEGGSTGALVSCILESREVDGTRIDRDEAATNGSNLGPVMQQHPTIDGYYVLQCELPPGLPRGTIASYRYFEPSPTDRNN